MQNKEWASLHYGRPPPAESADEETPEELQEFGISERSQFYWHHTTLSLE